MVNSAMPKTRFLFSVVMYNSKKVVGPALDSVVSVIGPQDALVVVDNGSSDGSAEYARKHAGDAMIIMQDNVGFGGGNNSAFRAMDSEFFVLVNPDIVIRDLDLGRVEQYMADHPEVAALVGDVHSLDGSRQYLQKRFPSIDVLFLRRFGVERERFKRRMENYEMRDMDFTKPFTVPCGTGCFQIIRRSAITEPDLFDPRYFMYFEDTDLSRRLAKQGETRYVPWIVVTHMWKRESHSSWRMTVIHASSMLKYWFKWKSFAPKAARRAIHAGAVHESL
jgi:GT2 family glycosyltransferase